jgi:hypothetical protein
MLLLLLEEEDLQNNKRRKRFSVHKMLKRRKTEGEYWTIFKELIDGEENLFSIFTFIAISVQCAVGKNQSTNNERRHRSQGSNHS